MYNFYSNRQKTNYVVLPGVPGSSPATAQEGIAPGVPEGTPHNHNAQIHYGAKELYANTSLDVNLYLQDFYTIYFWSPTFKNGGQSTIKSNKKGARFNLNTPYSIGGFADGSITYGVDFLNDVTSQYLIDGRVWAPEMNMKNLAPYMQLKTTVLKDFVLKGGLRFENIGVDVPDYTTLITINQTTGKETGGVAVNGGKLNYNAWVFNAGLRYTRFQEFNPYFSYSQGFTINELGRILRTAQSNYLQNLQPEAILINNYELGFNSRLNNNLSFSAAGYISTSKLGANTKELNGVYYVLRAPEEIYGFEVVADYKFNNKLQAGISYDYIEGKVDENNDGTFEKYLPGNRIMPQKFTTYIEYSPINKWSMKMQWLYTADRERFQPNATTGAYGYAERPVSSINVLNFSTFYTVNPKAKISLGVENLLNNDYYTINSQWENDAYLYQKGNGIKATVSLILNL
ncbi:TonB-dependent receptor [Solitalea lacus]|nr:TonB-dependent receptor [Solitalea lacus]